MGIAASMEEMQTKMMVNQRAMQIEMAMKQRQAGIAMQQAVGKERFMFYSALAFAAWTMLPPFSIMIGRPIMMLNLIPITFSWMLQYDAFCGNMIVRA